MDISNLSYSEMAQLRQTLDKEMAAKRTAAKKALAVEFAQRAAQEGFSIDEIFNEAAKKPTREAGVPKYANPDDMDQTWTGRGRKPQWVVEYQNKGGDMKAIEV